MRTLPLLMLLAGGLHLAGMPCRGREARPSRDDQVQFEDRVRALVAQLGDAQFKRREGAQAALAPFGKNKVSQI